MQTMEELIQSDPPTNFDNKDDDDEIYEKIEAPKFVDFTVPDSPPLLDDRSWFCLRVGCDLKHEEDMDPDAVYKRFVLRVMAARSPNVRLRKALLNKQAPSANLKCPLTAPAKSSKPRVSRMTAITSLSQKMADAKVKLHPISKLNLMTPHGKAKQISVASKYLTTPRYKKCIPNRDPFRSVQNPKNTTTMPRGKLVAKALVFNSPRKTQKRKTECKTPVTEICSEMKKLEISSQAKKSGKPSSSIPRGPTTCPTASVAKKSKPYNHNQKSRVETSRDCKDQEAKSSRGLKRKSKENLRKVQCAGPLENPDNDLSDMEIDEKSRNGSIDVCSTLDSSKSKEERLVSIAETSGAATTAQEENFPSSSETSLNGENRQTVSTDVTTYQCPSSVSTSEIDLEEKVPHIFETSDGVKNESNGHEESMKSNIEEDGVEPANTTGSESEAIFSEDKENVSASEIIFSETDDRESNLNCDNSQVKIHQHDSHDQKVNGAVTKTLKVSCNVAVTGSLGGGKYKKAKPTNPKPFRLRTDERGVLREAKLLAAPLREIAPVSKVLDGGDPQRRHGNETQQDEKSHGQLRRHENDSQEGNQAESDKIIQKIRPRQTPSYLKALKRVTEPKMSTATIRGHKKLEDGKEKAAKKMESRTTAKSPLLRQQLVKSHQRVVRTRNATLSLVTPGGLGVIKESSTTVLRPTETRPEVCGKNPTSIPTPTSNAGAAGRSTSRGKRPPTIPKEPNFHKIHTPKSCTKTPTKVISL